jgi:hypothetical protein
MCTTVVNGAPSESQAKVQRRLPSITNKDGRVPAVRALSGSLVGSSTAINLEQAADMGGVCVEHPSNRAVAVKGASFGSQPGQQQSKCVAEDAGPRPPVVISQTFQHAQGAANPAEIMDARVPNASAQHEFYSALPFAYRADGIAIGIPISGADAGSLAMDAKLIPHVAERGGFEQAHSTALLSQGAAFPGIHVASLQRLSSSNALRLDSSRAVQQLPGAETSMGDAFTSIGPNEPHLVSKVLRSDSILPSPAAAFHPLQHQGSWHTRTPLLGHGQQIAVPAAQGIMAAVDADVDRGNRASPGVSQRALITGEHADTCTVAPSVAYYNAQAPMQSTFTSVASCDDGHQAAAPVLAGTISMAANQSEYYIVPVTRRSADYGSAPLLPSAMLAQPQATVQTMVHGLNSVSSFSDGKQADAVGGADTVLTTVTQQSTATGDAHYGLEGKGINADLGSVVAAHSQAALEHRPNSPSLRVALDERASATVPMLPRAPTGMHSIPANSAQSPLSEDSSATAIAVNAAPSGLELTMQTTPRKTASIRRRRKVSLSASANMPDQLDTLPVAVEAMQIARLSSTQNSQQATANAVFAVEPNAPTTAMPATQAPHTHMQDNSTSLGNGLQTPMRAFDSMRQGMDPAFSTVPPRHSSLCAVSRDADNCAAAAPTDAVLCGHHALQRGPSARASLAAAQQAAVSYGASPLEWTGMAPGTIAASKAVPLAELEIPYHRPDNSAMALEGSQTAVQLKCVTSLAHSLHENLLALPQIGALNATVLGIPVASLRDVRYGELQSTAIPATHHIHDLMAKEQCKVLNSPSMGGNQVSKPAVGGALAQKEATFVSVNPYNGTPATAAHEHAPVNASAAAVDAAHDAPTLAGPQRLSSTAPLKHAHSSLQHVQTVRDTVRTSPSIPQKAYAGHVHSYEHAHNVAPPGAAPELHAASADKQYPSRAPSLSQISQTAELALSHVQKEAAAGSAKVSQSDVDSRVYGFTREHDGAGAEVIDIVSSDPPAAVRHTLSRATSRSLASKVSMSALPCVSTGADAASAFVTVDPGPPISDACSGRQGSNGADAAVIASTASGARAITHLKLSSKTSLPPSSEAARPALSSAQQDTDSGSLGTSQASPVIHVNSPQKEPNKADASALKHALSEPQGSGRLKLSGTASFSSQVQRLKLAPSGADAAYVNAAFYDSVAQVERTLGRQTSPGLVLGNSGLALAPATTDPHAPIANVTVSQATPVGVHSHTGVHNEADITAAKTAVSGLQAAVQQNLDGAGSNGHAPQISASKLPAAQTRIDTGSGKASNAALVGHVHRSSGHAPKDTIPQAASITTPESQSAQQPEPIRGSRGPRPKESRPASQRAQGNLDAAKGIQEAHISHAHSSKQGLDLANAAGLRSEPPASHGEVFDQDPSITTFPGHVQNTTAATKTDSVPLDPQAEWEQKIKTNTASRSTASTKQVGALPSGNTALASVLPFHALVSSPIQRHDMMAVSPRVARSFAAFGEMECKREECTGAENGLDWR